MLVVLSHIIYSFYILVAHLLHTARENYTLKHYSVVRCVNGAKTKTVVLNGELIHHGQQHEILK